MTVLHTSLMQILLGTSLGGVLGLAFFGGLWLTTQRIVRSPQPGMLTLVSFLVRMSILVAGLFFAAQVGPWCVFAATCGVLLARHWMIRRVVVVPEGARS